MLGGSWSPSSGSCSLASGAWAISLRLAVSSNETSWWLGGNKGLYWGSNKYSGKENGDNVVGVYAGVIVRKKGTYSIGII